VQGGQSVNTTAPHAQGQIDLRYVKPEQRAPALAALQAIIDSATVPGTSAKLEIKGEFLPVTSTPEAEELFHCYQAAAADAGLRVAGEFSGGCADSGFTAGVGCPTLCGVGPVGANAHTAEEYLEIDTLVPRAQAMALAILRLPAAVGRS
jgi:glutamate carboxypeptidase